jgi:hypothetical protein
MNNHHDTDAELEARLKQLRPAPASPELLARLRAHPPLAFARREPKRPWWRLPVPVLWPTAMAAAAAGVLLILTLEHRSTTNRTGGQVAAIPTATARPAVPSAVKNVEAGLKAEASADFLVGARKVGVWTSPEGQAFNVIQCLALNRTVWRNVERGDEFEKLEPRQRVLLVAMDTQ